MVREGGSIPIIATFSKILRVPCVLMGIGLNDDNLHAPNEKMDLDQFYGGIQASAALFEVLAEMPRRRSRELCERCHRRLEARPAGFPQVDGQQGANQTGDHDCHFLRGLLHCDAIGWPKGTK